MKDTLSIWACNGGWLRIEDGHGHFMRYLYYTKDEALQMFRRDFGYVGKRVTINDYTVQPGAIELQPIWDGRKSFYGKALVRYDATTDTLTLQSYQTDVCKIIDWNSNFPRFVRLWDGYSATTSRHVWEFFLQYAPALVKMEQCGNYRSGRQFWESFEVGKETRYYVEDIPDFMKI